MELRPNTDDYRRLWQQNSLAEAQLKAIVLERMYRELLAEAARLVRAQSEANSKPDMETPDQTAQRPSADS